jgi:flagellar biosynthesis chaperone FliJ
VHTFKYRLQTLLDLKIDRKAELQVCVAQRHKELAAEQEELEQLQQTEKQLEEKLLQARRAMLSDSVGSTAVAIRQHRDYLSGLAADLEMARNSTFSQQSRVRKFEEKLAEAKRQLTECLREIDVLTKHRDRLQQRFLRAVEAREAAEQDEIGAVMFLRKETAS